MTSVEKKINVPSNHLIHIHNSSHYFFRKLLNLWKITN